MQLRALSNRKKKTFLARSIAFAQRNFFPPPRRKFDDVSEEQKKVYAWRWRRANGEKVT